VGISPHVILQAGFLSAFHFNFIHFGYTAFSSQKRKLPSLLWRGLLPAFAERLYGPVFAAPEASADYSILLRPRPPEGPAQALAPERDFLTASFHPLPSAPPP
jgi:hypothetical protein